MRGKSQYKDNIKTILSKVKKISYFHWRSQKRAGSEESESDQHKSDKPHFSQSSYGVYFISGGKIKKKYIS